MKKLAHFLATLLRLGCLIFTVYVFILLLQGKNAKQEILSWFDNTVTLTSVMEDTGLNREDAFQYILDTTDPEDLPDALATMKDHVFLESRGEGICADLDKDVRAIVIFTNVLSAPWTAEEMAEVQADFETTAQDIMAEAASYGVSLNLTLEYHTGSVLTESPVAYRQS